jgi:hypothetical protein
MKQHGTYRRSNSVPVSHPLFGYDSERPRVVQVRVAECVAKIRVTWRPNWRRVMVWKPKSVWDTGFERDEVVHPHSTLRTPSSYLQHWTTECAWIGKSHNIRTIRRIAITLVVVYKHTGFGTWFPRPARVEDVLVFVLPKYHSRMDPFCKLDDDFVPLRGARERMRTECDCSTDRRHGVNSLHDRVSPEHPGDPGREPIDVHGSPFCRAWMHAERLCYNEIRRIV